MASTLTMKEAIRQVEDRKKEVEKLYKEREEYETAIKEIDETLYDILGIEVTKAKQKRGRKSSTKGTKPKKVSTGDGRGRKRSADSIVSYMVRVMSSTESMDVKQVFEAVKKAGYNKRSKNLLAAIRSSFYTNDMFEATTDRGWYLLSKKGLAIQNELKKKIAA